MNGPVIFMDKGTNVNPRLRANSLVTRYGLTEESCVITNKAAYMDYYTWDTVMKVVAPSIRKIRVSNVACVFPILFSIYLTIHICPSKSSSDDLLFSKVVGITHI